MIKINFNSNYFQDIKDLFWDVLFPIIIGIPIVFICVILGLAIFVGFMYVGAIILKWFGVL